MTTASLKITLIRTSCLLIQYDRWNLLTDPWFGSSMRGLPVFRKPGVALADLPPIDVVVASHLHRDHFDREAVASLATDDTVILGPYGTKRHCRSIPGANVRELDPWERTEVGELGFMATPALHTGPPPQEINYILELGPWRLFFGGDARFSSAFSEIAARVESIHIALLPIGGTLIFGHRTTMGPADAVRAASVLRPAVVVPIHEGGEWMSVPPASWHPGRFTDFAALLEQSDSGAVPEVLEPGQPFEFQWSSME
ncbi:MAG: hypothetical protein CMH54_04220 [Myxococcales bacterium]|nr:hypothetical protein [Myxococcales bacterium]